MNYFQQCVGQRRNRKHVECQPARLKKDEQAIQDLLSTLDDFKSLQTGIVATTEILEDLNIDVDDGKEKVIICLKKEYSTKKSH